MAKPKEEDNIFLHKQEVETASIDELFFYITPLWNKLTFLQAGTSLLIGVDERRRLLKVQVIAANLKFFKSRVLVNLKIPLFCNYLIFMQFGLGAKLFIKPQSPFF